MRKVLFVCWGNICRSAMAEFICKHLRRDIYCESRGISYEEEGNDMYPPAKRCLDEHGIPYGRHHARRIEKEDYARFDEIYVMEDKNLSYLFRIITDPERKVHKLAKDDIADPWWTGDFETVYEQLIEAIEKL